jgi:hypothetical protein
MITRYNTNGEVDEYGDFVRVEDVEPLVDFLYQVMTSNADVAFDLLMDHGVEFLEKFRVV